MKASDIFGGAYESAKGDVGYAKERVVLLRNSKKELMPVLRMLAPLLNTETDYIYVTVNEYSKNIRVVLRELDGFKSQRLTRILYATMCLKGATEGKTRDYPEMLNRDFNFKINDQIGLQISAYVKTDSATCRKVQVGEELQVVAKYEIQCD